MELVGVERLLTRLQNRGLTIGSVTTDRSSGLIRLLSESFPSITHYRDPWHSIHGFFKRLRPVRTSPH